MNTILLGVFSVSSIGQGTWYLGEDERKFQKEADVIYSGYRAGANLIDTAEMYADGGAEAMLSYMIPRVDREKLYIVSKVYPHNAGKDRIFTACDNSLKRLGTDYLDLYLLHWRGRIPLKETVDCMEELVKRGKIRRWGVSNFDIDDMQELFSVDKGENCLVNQVLYHMGSRGIEYSLLPWMRQRDVRLMAYCPLAQNGVLRSKMFMDKDLKLIAAKHSTDIHSIMLSWSIRDKNTIAIPRTSNVEHALNNVRAMDIALDEEDLHIIDTNYPKPDRKQPLDIQ